MDQEVKAQYTISEAAKLIGVSTKTLRKWDKDGIMVPTTTPGGHRRYTENQVKNCNKNFDPGLLICSMSEEDMENYAKYANSVLTKKISVLASLKEIYEEIYFTVVQLSNVQYRKSDLFRAYGDRGSNLIIASPEVTDLMGRWIYSRPMEPGVVPMGPTRYLGMVNSKWRVYSTTLLPAGWMVLGTTIDGTLDMTPNSRALAKLEFTTIL